MAAAFVLEPLLPAPSLNSLEPSSRSEPPAKRRAPCAASTVVTKSMDTQFESKSRNVIIHTGNVRRCNHQAISSPSTRDEIVTALKCTLHCWRNDHADTPLLDNELIGHPKLMDRIDPDTRHDKQITAKLFVTGEYSEGFVTDSLRSVLKTLAVDRLDAFIVQLRTPNPEDDGLGDDFVSMWQELETKQDLATALGVVDFSAEQLDQMSAAGLTPPHIDQLEASKCRTIPSVLRKMAKERQMKLLSHQDHGAPLEAEDFEYVMNKILEGQEAFTPLSTPSNSPPNSPESAGRGLAVSWRPLWVLRYNVIDTTRSIVDNLGYIICGHFDPKGV